MQDPRGLHQVFHTWDTSNDGELGALTTSVTVPADWQGPFFLNLYADDTYVADGWEQVRDTWTHRYAACLPTAASPTRVCSSGSSVTRPPRRDSSKRWRSSYRRRRSPGRCAWVTRFSPLGRQKERLLVRQHKADGYEVLNGSDQHLTTGQQWAEPISLEGAAQGVSGQVRHFAQQHPNRMWQGQGGQVVLKLFSRTIEHEQYVMGCGEAKRHELLLYFHQANRQEPRVQAALTAFETPSALLSPEWYADHQALGRGVALTKARFPQLHKWMLEN